MKKVPYILHVSSYLALNSKQPLKFSVVGYYVVKLVLYLAVTAFAFSSFPMENLFELGLKEQVYSYEFSVLIASLTDRS